MVTTMIKTWTQKYHTREEFLANFLTEQEYIDQMFILLIMENYGLWLRSDSLKYETVVSDRSQKTG